VTSITLTIDLEDPTGAYAPDGRWIAMAYLLLDFCDEIQCRATFFTVGRVAQASPNLIANIAARGHEIAHHTHNHVFLTQENPTRFRRETQNDTIILEQLTGKAVLGFRAPGFSLTPKTLWALDVLKDLGFRYSSSIMPTRLSRFGFPAAPRHSFTWPNGMVEFPLPVASVGPLRVPYLGGVYLYALPSFLPRLLAGRAGERERLWTYTHPFDFDVEASFERMPATPIWISWTMWHLRKHAAKKIRRILELGTAPPLAERLEKPT
jgi:polysaccharide deacetylase family protein (PEP-CTERM system associated)